MHSTKDSKSYEKNIFWASASKCNKELNWNNLLISNFEKNVGNIFDQNLFAVSDFEKK